MWDSLVQHDTIESIMKDKGLAQIGDNIVNFLYSLAKSVVTGVASGEKVRDSVLAKAIRSTSVYHHIGRRTDAGRAADAYEAVVAYLWMKDNLDIKDVVRFLTDKLDLDSTTNRKREAQIASEAFRLLLEDISDRLPQ